MHTYKQIIIISGNMRAVHNVLIQLPKITSSLKIDPDFLSVGAYPAFLRNSPDTNTKYDYVFYVGKPQISTQEQVLDILAEQLPQAKVVQLEIPIDEEQLMELIRTELAQGSNVEGGQTNPHGGKEK
ncbi:MAG: hypothetical protein AAB893_01310 [Patescibacteria group bacterium]